MYAAQCYIFQLDDTNRLMLGGLKAAYTMDIIAPKSLKTLLTSVFLP